jgi:DNA-binding LacI/PurR family transcriptional regulator
MAGDRPTLDTVAAAAGVSRMTVSNAYNRPDQLAAATRQHVLETARQLGYAGPDPTAASLRLRRTGTVGVVLTESLPYAFTDPGLMMILHGIATELSDAGNALLLIPAYDADGESLLRHAMVDALILCSLAGEDPAVAAAIQRQVPLVTVGNPRLRGVPRLGPDNRQATADLADYLFRLGHRRFAAVTTVSGAGVGPIRPLFHERVDGFTTAVTTAGAGPVEVVCAADNSRSAGYDIVTQLLSRSPDARPTAIFAVTDVLALGVLDAAADALIPVPLDLSVAGFDDIEAAANSHPSLTTVAQDLFGQGRAAARLAVRLIEGQSVRAPRFASRVVQRESTGPAPRITVRRATASSR